MLPCRSTILCYNQGGKCQDIRRKMSGYMGDISCIGRGRHDISWRKIEGEIFMQILPKYRRYIGSGRYIGDFLKKSPLVAKYRRFISDILPIFWRYFPSFMQRDLTAQITLVLIRLPKCDSNGKMAIQLPKCDSNGNMTIQQPNCS